ncbi:Wzz/FepE/Etk N-terminal domain-containing protein [Kitasatospora sp. NPDC004240]
MTTRTTAQVPAAAPLVDLQALVVAVRRRRRLWSALAVLGLLAGTALAVLQPPPPTAVVKVLVAHQEDQPNDPGTLIRTDVALLQTTGIAGKALQSVGSTDRPEDFLKDYTGLGLTNTVLQITVTARSEKDAVARAEALAEAFIADHVRRIRETAEAQAKALLDQRDRLREELAQVNQAIGDGAAPSGSKAPASLESLFASRAELTSRITDFGQRAAEARVGMPRLVAGTQIVDAPRAVRQSRIVTVATDAGMGFVLGLVVGLVVAAVGSVVADRPVLRRDVAEGLGASVIAELRRVPGGPAGRWRGRRARAARARLTTTLARTVRGSAEPVSLLELGCARSTGSIARDLAKAWEEEGPVVLVDELPVPRFAGRGPKAGEPAVAGGGPAAAEGPERRLGIGSVAPGTAWTDLRHLGTRTVLVVRAGHGSTAWLHTVARQLADQDVQVIGVVLIDPDPRDRTDGTLWDGPRTPARGRGGEAALRNGTGRWRTERRPMGTARAPGSDQEVR